MTPETILEHDGVTQTIIDWALDYGITPGIIIARLERGLSVSEAITTPMQIGHPGQRLPVFSKEQVKSRKRVERYTANGHTKSLNEWAEHIGVTAPTLIKRLARMTMERAIALGKSKTSSSTVRLYTHDGQSKTLKEWAEHTGIKTETLRKRFKHPDMTLEQALTTPNRNHQKTKQTHPPGVSDNLLMFSGTGAGKTVQENPNLTFSQEAAE